MSQKLDTRYNDKLSQLPSYFAKRNNVNPLPLIKEGINYTNETLFYMCPSARSDRIASSMALPYGDKRSFMVVEWFSGCGGNTLGFLAHPQIKAVMSFEVVPERREMLKNNVSVYGDDFKCKSIIPDEGFNGQDLSMYAGSCLMLDPAWLDPSVDPSTSTKDDYILSGMTTAGQTLEYWIEYYSNTFYYFELHVPPGYEFDSSVCPSWTVKYKDEENGLGKITHRRWYGINKSMASAVKSNKGGLGPFVADIEAGKCLHGSLGDISPSNKITTPSSKFAPPSSKFAPSSSKFAPPSGKIAPSPNKFAPSPSKTVPSPSKTASSSTKQESIIAIMPETAENTQNVSWVELCATLPGRPEELGSDEWFEGLATREWLLGFQTYLYSLLSFVVKDEDHLRMMIDKDNIGIWIRAFTHITYNLKVNYENLELDGDKVLNYDFPHYLRRRFPNATVKEMTEYNHRYMSKEFQYIWAREMKLDQWLLCDQVDPSHIKIAEDLFESFFGALTEVSNNIIDGLGVIYSFNYLKLIFDGTEFNINMTLGKPISVLQQRGNRAKWGTGNDGGKVNDGGIDVKESSKESGSPYTVELYLRGYALDILRSYGINLPSPLGVGKATNLKIARETAWKNALDNSNKRGYTHEWAIAYKEQLLFDGLGKQYADLVDAARAKSREMGYDSMDFDKVSGGISSKTYKNEDGTTITINSTTSILKGINSNTLKEESLSIGRGIDQNSSYVAALQNFVGWN